MCMDVIQGESWQNVITSITFYCHSQPKTSYEYSLIVNGYGGMDVWNSSMHMCDTELNRELLTEPD